VRALVGVARVFFARIERGENAIGALDTDTAMPTRRLVELGLWLFALAVAFPFLPGSHTYAFKGVSVLAGLAASIAASSVLAQAASGLTLLYGRVIRRGEYIAWTYFEGKVSANRHLQHPPSHPPRGEGHGAEFAHEFAGLCATSRACGPAISSRPPSFQSVTRSTGAT
jgi:hypothetical protein